MRKATVLFGAGIGQKTGAEHANGSFGKSQEETAAHGVLAPLQGRTNRVFSREVPSLDYCKEMVLNVEDS